MNIYLDLFREMKEVVKAKNVVIAKWCHMMTII